MSVVSLRSVSKSYGSSKAVNAVSLEIPSSCIFGLLGPNGAGKTSTIRMITGITLPDEGEISLFGEPQRADHQNMIGYMPEERGLYRKLTVRNQLEYLGALKGLDKSTLKKSIDYWLNRFEIQSWAKKKTNELSKGMQQKLQFIVTVLHDPQLLVLDEPLSGLDPVNSETINEIILEERNKGKTILLSTHRMEQVEQLCDEIALMNLGEIVLSGKLRDVKERSGKKLVRVLFSGAENPSERIAHYPIRIIDKHPNELLFEMLPGAEAKQILRTLLDHVDVIRWELIEPPLKEIFLDAISTK
ncbi:MAG: ATP-binding cassette domain-containing protein [Bacteroidota bacterium]|nr:ATP-binding cassette domain-containing protein [Bacteroidota bacterium]MDP4236337.1 ATP-binding cassette domain-containing protein [Bacteroidota bacterium]